MMRGLLAKDNQVKDIMSRIFCREGEYYISQHLQFIFGECGSLVVWWP